MDATDVVDRAREALGVQGVFGTPIKEGDAVLVPVARIRGGVGGGSGGPGQEQGQGQGAGYGIMATPAGAFVFRQGTVTWQPAVDVNRVIMGAQIAASLGILAFARVAKIRARTAARRQGLWRARMRRVFKR